MGDIDAETLDAAARRYMGLRRRYRRCFLGFVALWAAAATTGYAFGPRVESLVGTILFLSLYLGLTACWGVGFLAYLSLRRFRCPRCGERFLWPWEINRPPTTCKHCGLYLG